MNIGAHVYAEFSHVNPSYYNTVYPIIIQGSQLTPDDKAIEYWGYCPIYDENDSDSYDWFNESIVHTALPPFINTHETVNIGARVLISRRLERDGNIETFVKGVIVSVHGDILKVQWNDGKNNGMRCIAKTHLRWSYTQNENIDKLLLCSDKQ